MPNVQRMERIRKSKAPQIIDNRSPKPLDLPPVDQATANLPLRTVFFMEVGAMEPAKVQLLIQQANEMYEGAKGGIHYVLPVRDGKIRSDIVFEGEWLAIVKETCEIKDGQIVLKDGASECQIVRNSI